VPRGSLTLRSSLCETASTEVIGVIAGNGELPRQLIQAILTQGKDVVLIGISGEVSKETLKEAKNKRVLKLGAIDEAISFFKAHGVLCAIFIGGVNKGRFLTHLTSLLLSRSARQLIAKCGTSDDNLLRGVAEYFTASGITIKSANEFLPKVLIKVDSFTTRAFTEEEESDAALGIKVCEALSDLDIGQAVVVFRGSVIAIEGIEGTDQLILRAGKYLDGKGGILIKFPKINQDLRLDLPTIGKTTINNMKRSGLTALAVLEDGVQVVGGIADTLKGSNIALKVYERKTL
jgi:hypothetical protein